MKSSDTPKGSKKPPARLDCKFFLADDIRLEQNGKSTLIGFYPDDVLVLQLPKSAPDPTPQERTGISSLTVMASFPNAKGSKEAQVALTGPSNVEILRSDKKTLVADAKSLNLIFRFSPMQIVGFGMYEFSITLDKVQYNYKFEVRRGEIDPAQSGQIRFKTMQASEKPTKQAPRPAARKRRG